MKGGSFLDGFKVSPLDLLSEFIDGIKPKTTRRSKRKSLRGPLTRSLARPSTRSLTRPSNRRLNRSLNRSLKPSQRPTNRSLNPSLNRSLARPSNRSQRPTNRSLTRPSNRSQRPSPTGKINTKLSSLFGKNVQSFYIPKKTKLPSLDIKNPPPLPIENSSKKKAIQSVIQRFAKGEALSSNETKILEEKGLKQT